MNGKLIIISGPSGVGKSTICKELVRRLDNVFLSVSTTSRPQKAGEENGREYWFVSREEFENRIKEGRFLEYAEVFGNLYGTEKEKVEQALNGGKQVILEIDVQGAVQVQRLYPQAKLIFILPPTQRELAERMNLRGREDAQTAEKRLNGAGIEIAAAWQYYEHMVINDDLEQAVKEIVQIIKQSIGEKE